MTTSFTVTGVEGVPLIKPGDDLAAILIAAVGEQDIQLLDGDIIVIAQKIVSKAEGRLVDLSAVDPSAEASKLAEKTDKNPQHVELILQESREIVRSKPGVIVVEHRLGHVLANAGIDRSNVEAPTDGESALLLPVDPDASAAALKDRFEAHWNRELGVLIADSVGRAWRLGTVGIAIGAAGVASLHDQRGDPDLFGRPMETTVTGHADAIASAATLLMGEAAEATPAAVVRGVVRGEPAPARSINRPKAEDMFR